MRCIERGRNMIKLPNSRRELQLIVILLTVIHNDEVGSFIAFLLDGFYAKVSIYLNKFKYSSKTKTLLRFCPVISLSNPTFTNSITKSLAVL